VSRQSSSVRLTSDKTTLFLSQYKMMYNQQMVHQYNQQMLAAQQAWWGGGAMGMNQFNAAKPLPKTKANKKARQERRKEVLEKSGMKAKKTESKGTSAPKKETKGTASSKKTQDEDEEKWDVMLSYQWDHQKQVKDIKKELEKSGLTVWMDLEQMQGGMNERMAEAIAFSRIIVVCLSEKYAVSKNCKKEYTYADQCDREIIPVKMQSAFNVPRGTALDLLMGDKLWYDMEKDFNKKVMELTKGVKKALKDLADDK